MTDIQNNTAEKTLSRMPMLVWRMDLAARVFENLNDFSGSILSRENFRFFKDPEYMRDLLLPEDLPTVTRAVSKIKERMPVQAVFRIHDGEKLLWFKLTGWATENHKYYEGTVEDISVQVTKLQDLFAGQGQRLFTIEETAYPVAIFSSRNQLLVKCNDSFKDLLGMTVPNKIKYLLSEVISSEVKFSILLEYLLLHGNVVEELSLISANGQSIKTKCALELFSYGTEDMIRIAVLDVFAEQGAEKGNKDNHLQTAVSKLCDSFAHATSIDEMLSAIYAEQELFPDMAVAIFSDIYAKKNKAIAYAQGALLENLRVGQQFPYSGTIAEHIEKENLEYLIMDDTHSSIKAIDWMLFVPNGIRSYIAKALYVRGAMRTVIILCSEKKQAFGEHQIKELTEIATAFHQRLKKIRKS